MVSAARPIRLVAKPNGGARTAGAVRDADRPQLALIKGYRDELAPIVAAYGQVDILIRPATPAPPPPRIEPPPTPPDWADLDGWRRCGRHARGIAALRNVVAAWARAAGGDVRDNALRLPANLRCCLALAELKNHARYAGLAVEEDR